MNMKFRHIALAALFALSTAAHAQAKSQDSFDLTYSGDLAGLVSKLHQIDPGMAIRSNGAKRDVPVTLKITNGSKVDILRAIGEQAGEKADLAFSPASNTLKISYREAPKPVFTPPVERSADGSVVVTFGQAKPQLNCQAFEPCAIELEAGEKINRLDVGDPSRWEVSPSIVGEGERRAIIVMVRPTASTLRTKLVLATNRRIYSIILSSPANATDDSDSRMWFRYPT